MLKKLTSIIILLLLLSGLSITTSAAVYTYSSAPGRTILYIGTLWHTIRVTDSLLIDDLNVALDITRPVVADLRIQLTSPTGTKINLVVNGQGSNIQTTLDDESGNGPVNAANPPTGPSYTPQQPLSAFDGENAQGVWTLRIDANTVSYANLGKLNSWSLIVDDGIPLASSTNNPNNAPNPDPDNDGVDGSRDNCPQAYNPDQEDGWGSAMGDACDTQWYNHTGQGLAGFTQKDGLFHLHGNCTFLADGAPRCPVIAVLDPASFTPDAMPMTVTTADAGTWSVVVHYLHGDGGTTVYQVNTYSTNPPQPDTLVDDRLEIHVSGATWRWYMRGGDPNYNGN